MNEIKIFENAEFGKVRVVDVNGEPWFVGKDVAESLGYVKARNAIATHIDDDDKMEAPIHGDLGGVQNMTIINESGVYSLAFGSKLPNAKLFKKCVTKEVLPSIRKTGRYSTDKPNYQELVSDKKFLLAMQTQLIEMIERAEKAEGTVAILTHVNKTYTVTEIAKELNMKSAIELNKKLAELHIQYKVNGTWVLYSKYSNLGYEEIKQEVLDSGRVVYHRKITQRGREFIIGAINKALEAVS